MTAVIALYTVAAATDRPTTWRVGLRHHDRADRGRHARRARCPGTPRRTSAIFAWTGMAGAAGRRGAQPPRLRPRDPGARRTGRAHPRGGGPPPGRRGAAAHRPRSARRRRPPHRPGQRAGRRRRPRHGQAPRPGQGGARPRPRGQPLRAERTARHRRPAAPVRRPRGPDRTGPRPRPPGRTRRHLPQCGAARGGGRPAPEAGTRPGRTAGRRRPGRVPRHPGGPDQCAEACGHARRRPRSASCGSGRTMEITVLDNGPGSRAAPGGPEAAAATGCSACASGSPRSAARCSRRPPLRRRLPRPCDPAGRSRRSRRDPAGEDV